MKNVVFECESLDLFQLVLKGIETAEWSVSVAVDNCELFALSGCLPVLVNADFFEEASTNPVCHWLITSLNQRNLVFNFIKSLSRLLRCLELFPQLFLLLEFDFLSLKNNVECLEQLGPSHPLYNSSHHSDVLNHLFSFLSYSCSTLSALKITIPVILIDFGGSVVTLTFPEQFEHRICSRKVFHDFRTARNLTLEMSTGHMSFFGLLAQLREFHACMVFHLYWHFCSNLINLYILNHDSKLL